VEIDPVAYVLLRAGQTTVQATDINDVRSSISPSSLLISTAASSVPSDLTLSDCSGANLVFHFISFAVGSANSQTFRLTNARIGLDLGFYIQNISGAPKFFGYQATTPAGTLQHIVAYNSQALSGVDMTSTGFTIQNNIAMIARTCLSNGQIIVLYQLP
jgi:hypothetical protein